MEEECGKGYYEGDGVKLDGNLAWEMWRGEKMIPFSFHLSLLTLSDLLTARS